MKKIFKKNQIIITALALMIAVAGYINYSDNIKKKNSSQSGAKSNGEILSNDAEPDGSYDDPGTTVYTSGVTSQFIASAKLEREQVRAANKETLLEVIDNELLSEDSKAQAIAGMVAISDRQEKEAAAELLLEAKGFSNVIVSIGEEQVDVVIETEELSDTQLAQIEDVVMRKTESSLENITITTVTVTNTNTEPESEKGDNPETAGDDNQDETEETQ